MDQKSPATAAPHLGPVFQDSFGILFFFTILTWSITRFQRLLPGCCKCCTCAVPKTTSTSVLADKKTYKTLNENEDDDINVMRSDAEIAMKNMGLNFDIENSIVLKTISSEYISMLFDHDEPSLQEVKMAFLVFDENNDGYIDASDLRRVLHNIGLGEQAGIGECEQMIARYDMNKDMRIDMMEFTKDFKTEYSPPDPRFVSGEATGGDETLAATKSPPSRSLSAAAAASLAAVAAAPPSASKGCGVVGGAAAEQRCGAVV